MAGFLGGFLEEITDGNRVFLGIKRKGMQGREKLCSSVTIKEEEIRA